MHISRLGHIPVHACTRVCACAKSCVWVQVRESLHMHGLGEVGALARGWRAPDAQFVIDSVSLAPTWTVF